MGLVYFIMDMKSVGRMFLENPSDKFAGLVSDPIQGLGIPFMLAGPILCAFCILTYIVVSYRSAPPSATQLENACWGSPLMALKIGKISGWNDPRLLAMVLFGFMCVLYLILK